MIASQKTLTKEIATLVNGRASKNPKNIIGEHAAEYRVTLHREPFWFTARISDDEFAFDAQHRRGFGEKTSFYVSLYHPWINMGATILQEELSESLRIPVFGSSDDAGLLASPVLEAPEIKRFLPAMRRDSCRLFFVNDTQLRVIAPLEGARGTSQRLLVLRDFMETVYRVSRFVNPHFIP
jgi:hypothetical protein